MCEQGHVDGSIPSTRPNPGTNAVNTASGMRAVCLSSPRCFKKQYKRVCMMLSLTSSRNDTFPFSLMTTLCGPKVPLSTRPYSPPQVCFDVEFFLVKAVPSIQGRYPRVTLRAREQTTIVLVGMNGLYDGAKVVHVF